MRFRLLFFALGCGLAWAACGGPKASPEGAQRLVRAKSAAFDSAPTALFFLEAAEMDGEVLHVRCTHELDSQQVSPRLLWKGRADALGHVPTASVLLTLNGPPGPGRVQQRFSFDVGPMLARHDSLRIYFMGDEYSIMAYKARRD